VCLFPPRLVEISVECVYVLCCVVSKLLHYKDRSTNFSLSALTVLAKSEKEKKNTRKEKKLIPIIAKSTTGDPFATQYLCHFYITSQLLWGAAIVHTPDLHSFFTRARLSDSRFFVSEKNTVSPHQLRHYDRFSNANSKVDVDSISSTLNFFAKTIPEGAALFINALVSLFTSSYRI